MLRANEVQLDLLRSPLHFTAKSEELTFFQKLSMVTRWANPWDMPRQDYMLTQLNAARTYLRLLFLPVNQNLDYDYPISKSLFEWGTFFSALLHLFIFAAAIWLYRRNRLFLYAVIWFYLNLLIESSVPMKDVFFEHRVYLPSVGFVLLAPYAFSFFIRQKKGVVSLLCGVIIVFSLMTYQRNKVWKNELTLWHDVIKKSPNKARPYIELGAAYGRLGDMDKVIEMNTKAIERDPYRALAYGNIGFAYMRKGDLEKAIKFFHEAFLYQEYLPWIANNLSVAYRMVGRLDQAVYWSEKAVKQNPLLPSSHISLGYHYFLKGEVEKGIAACQKAVELDPTQPEGYAQLGLIYLKLGEIEKMNEMIAVLKKLNREDLVKQLHELQSQQRK
jgi:tetratricopeptide (TPR) repeat protein